MQSGLFIENVFFFVSGTNKLCYVLENQSFHVTSVKKGYSLLCYQQQIGRLFLCTSDNEIMTISYPLGIIQFQNYILQDEE